MVIHSASIITRIVLAGILCCCVAGFQTLFAQTIDDGTRLQLRNISWGVLVINELNVHNQPSSGWQLQINGLDSPFIQVDELRFDCPEGQWKWTQSQCHLGDWQIQLSDHQYDGQFLSLIHI